MELGAQLYTLRAFTQNEIDFERTIARIAEMGYHTVQISAIGSIKPSRVRAICDGHGLRIALTHTDPERIRTNIQSVIDEHNTLGCRYVGIGSMPPRYRCAEWIDYFAVDYLQSARALKAAGMRLMYHNHNFEWERLSDGRMLLNTLLQTMPAELMGMTLDTYWVQAAGADVFVWAEKLKDRIACVHLKDMSMHGSEQRMAPVGRGNIDQQRLIAQLKAQGTTEHLFVEQDECYGESPFNCLRESRDYIMRECAL